MKIRFKKLPFPNPLFHYLLFKKSYIDLKYYIIYVKCIGYVGYKDYIKYVRYIEYIKYTELL